MKSLVVLGSTGSVGRQTLDIVREHPDRLRVVGLSAGRNAVRLAEQVREFRPQWVAMGDAQAAATLAEAIAAADVEFLGSGPAALCELARRPCDVVVNALLGYAGLRPTLAALEQGRDVALSNKETLVAAGEIVTAVARRTGARLLPVDSEHAALDQCLRSGTREEVQRLILTASGGPFRSWSQARMRDATVADALNHPTWNMGAKITVDSATLMNKGLEILEASWLFDVALEDIDVIVHPQSIVHSLVEFRDGSVVAQLGTTDMRLPIWSALHAPHRPQASFGRLDLAAIGSLTFEELDHERFPCVGLARQAGRQGGILPAVLNAANEVAVQAFLDGRIAFPGIAATITATLDRFAARAGAGGGLDLDSIAAADAEARRVAQESCRTALVPGDAAR